jgi:hypothetical protein
MLRVLLEPGVGKEFGELLWRWMVSQAVESVAQPGLVAARRGFALVPDAHEVFPDRYHTVLAEWLY